jgi:BASS family bile acid:Na+ symporter
MGMLFFAFLGCPLSRQIESYVQLLRLLAAMLLIGCGGYLIVLPLLGPDMALIAFLLGVTPTATAAPLVTSLIGGNLAYVSTAVLGTNLAMAGVLPLILPLMTALPEGPGAWSMLISILGLVLVPAILAQLARRGHPRLLSTLAALQPVSFYLWLVVVFLGTASATHHLRNTSGAPLREVLQVTGVALGVCVLSFSCGRLVGGKRHWREAAQSLGQKNTMLTTWIALAYLSPAAVLGPVLYLIIQNLYNAYLIGRARPRRGR